MNDRVKVSYAKQETVCESKSENENNLEGNKIED